MALLMALNGFVFFISACFKWVSGFSTGKKGLFFSAHLARTRIFTGFFTLSRWLCSWIGSLVFFFDVNWPIMRNPSGKVCWGYSTS